MSDERVVRLFRHGGNQALRIPREFALGTKEAIIRRDDGRLVMEPTRKIGLLATLAALPALEEYFPDLDEGMSNMDAIEVWLHRGLHRGLHRQLHRQLHRAFSGHEYSFRSRDD